MIRIETEMPDVQIKSIHVSSSVLDGLNAELKHHPDCGEDTRIEAISGVPIVGGAKKGVEFLVTFKEPTLS